MGICLFLRTQILLIKPKLNIIFNQSFTPHEMQALCVWVMWAQLVLLLIYQIKRSFPSEPPNWGTDWPQNGVQLIYPFFIGSLNSFLKLEWLTYLLPWLDHCPMDALLMTSNVQIVAFISKLLRKLSSMVHYHSSWNPKPTKNGVMKIV